MSIRLLPSLLAVVSASLVFHTYSIAYSSPEPVGTFCPFQPPPPPGCPPSSPSGSPGNPTAAGANTGRAPGLEHNSPALPPAKGDTSADVGSRDIASGLFLPVNYSGAITGEVNTVTRKPMIDAIDMDHSSNGRFGLTVSRTYVGRHPNYSDNHNGRTMLGKGWVLNWEMRLETYGNVPTIRTPRGSFIMCRGTTDPNIYEPDPATISGRLIKYPNGTPSLEYYILEIAGGDAKYRFNYYGQLEYMEDRNGNRMSCTYDSFASDALLTRVTASAPDNRYLDFEYYSPSNPLDKRTSRLKKITPSWFNRTINYTYSSDELAEVRDHWDRLSEGYLHLIDYLGSGYDFFVIYKPTPSGTDQFLRIYQINTGNKTTHVAYDPYSIIYVYDIPYAYHRDAFGGGYFPGYYSEHVYAPAKIEHFEYNSSGVPSLVRTDEQAFRPNMVSGAIGGTRLPLQVKLNGTARATLTYWEDHSVLEPYNYGYSRPMSVVRPGEMTTYFFFDEQTSRPTGWIQDYPNRWAGQNHDANGNVIELHANAESKTTYTLDVYGRILTKNTILGTETYRHDNYGNIREITDNDGRSTLFDYNGDNLLSAIGHLGTTTTLYYDSYHRLTTTTNHLNHSRLLAYDALDRATTATDEMGFETVYEYSPTSWTLTSVTDPEGGKISYEYDLAGQVTKLTDERGKVTTYKYDYKGRLIEEKNPLNQSTTYTYHESGCGGCGGTGQVETVTEPTGRKTTHTYDLADRLTTTSMSVGISILAQVINTYDEFGRLVARKDTRIPITDYSTSQTFAYVYDYDDRLLTVVYPDGEQIGYTYDAADRRVTMTDPDGNVTTYAYGATNNVAGIDEIQHSLFGTTEYYYNAKGLVEWELYPNFSNNYWNYDALNRVSITGSEDGINGRTILEASNTYNPASIRTRVDYYRHSVHGDSYYKLYAYDKAYRLTSQNRHRTSDHLREWGYGYQYDLAGNRIQMSEYNGSTTATTNIVYNDFNQLVEGYGHDYYYDANGNLQETTHGGAEYFHGWDNRLIGYDNGVDLIEYAYDSSGRLLVRTGTDGSKTKYYYDGINLLMVKEKPLSGVWRTKKVNALKENDIGQILAHREYTAWSGSTPTAYDDRWYHYDMLGNVVALTDGTGAVAAQYDMEAFGTVKSGSQNGVHLTTKEWDAESGLYYFNARWYDKGAGQWLQREPYGIDGPNLYHFGFNNPVLYYDSNGLHCKRKPYSPPDVTQFPLDPTDPPGPGWVWKGPKGSRPGVDKGAWHHPKSGDSLFPDLKHAPPVGPHWDWKCIDHGETYRWFPDGSTQPKTKSKPTPTPAPTPRTSTP